MKTLTQTILVLTTSLWLVGCATNSNNMRAQGAGTGALIVGTSAAALCNSKNRMVCAIAGAIAGAGLGYLIGNEVAKRKEKYATWEKLIVGETRQITQLVSQTHATNHNLTLRIDYNRKEIKRLTSLKQLKITQKETLQKRYSEVSELVNHAKNKLDALDHELQVQQQLYNDSTEKISRNNRSLQNWNGQIAQLQQARDRLNRNVTTLLSINQTV